ncbi:MAG: DUF3560 domain-containing protein, partial [Acidobacteria bacterium]|nr:DUF3560 domain-containing protein [Acidobacteriota bacterium]
MNRGIDMTKKEATEKLQGHKELAERLGYECEWRIAKQGQEWVLTTRPEDDGEEQPLPESIADDGSIAVNEPIEPAPQDVLAWDELTDEAKRRAYDDAIRSGDLQGVTYEDFDKIDAHGFDWHSNGTMAGIERPSALAELAKVVDDEKALESHRRAYVGFATYNLCTDKLHAEFQHRLSEAEYKRIRCYFSYWPGSKQFVAKWSPGAEDVLQELGIDEIEDDDRPDDVEARVDRFDGYADNAAKSADSAHKYVKGITDYIPMGQPILLGHHSERHARADQKRIEGGMRRAISDADRAAYWQNRKAAAIHHAEYKERPGVIKRRIEHLQRDERRYIKNMSEREKARRWLNFRSDEQWKAERAGAQFDLEDVSRRSDQAWERNLRHYTRWLEHVRMVIEYQQELYKQSGGVPADNLKPEKGGGVMYGGQWYRVVRVNRKTVEIHDPSNKWWTKRDLTKISAVMSK